MANGDKRAKRKIVCVEDEPDMIDLVRLILERQNYQVVGALGGKEGIETIRREKPRPRTCWIL